MIKGVYMKGEEIQEVYRGNGITELIPVEEKEVDAPFYFLADMTQPKSRWKNVAICTSVVAPMWGVALLNNIPSDAVFTGLCWLSLIWAGIVVFANVRR